MEIVKKFAYELTSVERTQIRACCIRCFEYGMNDFLKLQKKEPHKYHGYLFMLYSNKKLIAWSAIIEASYGGKK